MILLDAMMQLYRTNYKLPDLQTTEGRLTGMEYGFIKSIEALRRYFKDEIILCWEGRRNFRYEIDPEYKANRRAKRSNHVNHLSLNFERINDLRKFLLMIAENACDPELEADDIIASLAEQYCKTEPVYIYSSDKDLHQLLRNASPHTVDKTTKKIVWKKTGDGVNNHFAVSQIKNYQHREKPWTPRRVEEKYYSLTPEQFKLYQAWVGDPIDNIPGSGARAHLIAAAIQAEYQPHNMSDYQLFTMNEMLKLDTHFTSGRFEKNLKLVTLVINPNIVVKQRDYDRTKIGEWLRDMQFRSLKICRECGIEPTISADEDF